MAETDELDNLEEQLTGVDALNSLPEVLRNPLLLILHLRLEEKQAAQAAQAAQDAEAAETARKNRNYIVHHIYEGLGPDKHVQEHQWAKFSLPEMMDARRIPRDIEPAILFEQLGLTNCTVRELLVELLMELINRSREQCYFAKWVTRDSTNEELLQRFTASGLDLNTLVRQMNDEVDFNNTKMLNQLRNGICYKKDNDLPEQKKKGIEEDYQWLD